MRTNIELIQLRSAIESITKEILTMVEARNKIARQIGLEKRKLNLPLEDSMREEQLLKRIKATSCLSEELVEELYVTLAKAARGSQV